MQKPQQYEALIHSHSYSPNQQVDFLSIKVLDKDFSFQEGQFIMIWIEIDGMMVKRSYSIATTFSQFQKDQTLGFIIKTVPEGLFSKRLWKAPRIGEKINIVGPLGHMKLPENTQDKNFVLISTGSGFSPIHGIFSHLLETQEYQNILHLHGEKSQEWLIEKEMSILTHKSENISNFLCLSREEQEIYPNQYKGYVTQKIEEIFPKWSEKIKGEILCYICGKPETVNTIIDQLVEFGINKNNIKCEKY